MPTKYERVHNLSASDREQPQRAPSPRPVRIEKITWADAELWRSELSQGIYGSMSTTEPVSVRITRFDGALPPTELISNGAHSRRRQAMRRWLVGGSLAALGGLVMVLCLVVAFAGGSGVKGPSSGESVGALPQQSASPPLDLGAEQKREDQGTQKGAAPVVEPKPAFTPPPRVDPVQATKDGGPDYPQSAPSDPQITIPAPVGCLEAMCEPYVAAIGKRFDDHDNVRLLDCLQRTGMSQGDSKACFLAANLPVSPSRRALYMCGVCKGCMDVPKEEKHELNCEKATAETPSTGKGSDWHQYVPSANGV